MKLRSSFFRLLDPVFLLLLAAYISAGMPLVPFHGDEATQIYMSHDYGYQFLQRDLRLVEYSNPPISAQEQDLRLLNGTITKYLIGLAWYLGGFTVDDLNEQWDWGGDWNYNQQNNHAPSEPLLMVARLPPTLLLAAGVLVMFALGWQLGGRPAAYLAALFYAFNPVLLLNGRRAIMEGSLICFSLLTVLAAVWWLKIATAYSPPPSPTQAGRGGVLARYRTWIAAIILGLMAGLALSSKHPAVFTVATVFGACGLWIVFSPSSPNPFSHASGEKGDERDLRPSPRLRGRGGGGEGYRRGVQQLLSLCLAAIVALTIFYILNPAWWGDPVTRAGQVLERRHELLNEQVAFFGGYDGVGDALAGFLRQTFIAQPQYFEAPGWENYIGDQLVRYEASPLRGVTIGGSIVSAVIFGGLVLVGFWALCRDNIIPASTRWLVGIWTLALIVTTMLLTPIEWQRYYLPVSPAISLLAALGAWWIMRMIRQVWLTKV